MTPQEKSVENTIPVLAVRDLAESLRFYQEHLDFTVDWQSHGGIASVSRDGHAIMLQRRSGGTPGCVWIGGPGLRALWDKAQSDPAIVVTQRPTNQPWALEMRIRDPDGNELWFGTESIHGVEFGREPTAEQLKAR